MYVDYCIANIDHYGIIYNIDFAGRVEYYRVLCHHHFIFMFFCYANNVTRIFCFLLVYQFSMQYTFYAIHAFSYGYMCDTQ